MLLNIDIVLYNIQSDKELYLSKKSRKQFTLKLPSKVD